MHRTGIEFLFTKERKKCLKMVHNMSLPLNVCKQKHVWKIKKTGKNRKWVQTCLMDGVTCMLQKAPLLSCFTSTLFSCFSLTSLGHFNLFLFSLCLVFILLHSHSLFLFYFYFSAIAPDFSQNLLKAQTLARQSGDVLIECKPRMSPRGIISWRKGKEALRESHRYK